MPDLLVTDPSTGQLVGRLPCSDADELVAAARAAHPVWARTSPGERAPRSPPTWRWATP